MGMQDRQCQRTAVPCFALFARWAPLPAVLLAMAAHLQPPQTSVIAASASPVLIFSSSPAACPRQQYAAEIRHTTSLLTFSVGAARTNKPYAKVSWTHCLQVHERHLPKPGLITGVQSYN